MAMVFPVQSYSENAGRSVFFFVCILDKFVVITVHFSCTQTYTVGSSEVFKFQNLSYLREWIRSKIPYCPCASGFFIQQSIWFYVLED